MLGRADTMLLFGETNTGKTVQLGELAQWLYRKSQEMTRLISADSGWDPIEHLIWGPNNPDGCIEAFNVQYLKNPFPMLTKFSEGYWPMLHANGKLLMGAPQLRDGQIISANGRPVGAYANEGLSTFSDLLLFDHIRNSRKIGQDMAANFTDSVEIMNSAGQPANLQVQFGKAAPAHYGHVQEYMLSDLIPRFGQLPVRFVWWTAHEAKGDDDITGIKGSVLGPMVIGKAATGRTTKKFGDTFHIEIAASTVQGPKGPVQVLERRAYYEPHPDGVLTKILWPAKLSFPLHRVEELKKRFPGGFVPLTLTSGLPEFMNFKHGIVP